MAGHSRYNLTDAQAGIENGILKNKLNIKDQRKLDDAETLLLNDAYAYFFALAEKRRITFDLAFLFSIHKFFLEPLYTWAGKTRTIDLSKDEMLFAPVKFLDKSLNAIKVILRQNEIIRTDPKQQVARRLAIIHNEFNSVHPFREGNGRTIRLFLDLISVSNGYNPINWSKQSHKTYILACKKGLIAEHKAMARIIYVGLTKK
jgi:cell filamentation protein